MRKSVVGMALVGLLALSGCGSDGGDNAEQTEEISVEDAKSTSIDDITVEGAAGEQPRVKFEPPLVITDPSSKLITEGDGPVVEEGHQVSAQMTLFAGNDGAEVESSYEANSPASFPVDPGQINQALFDAVKDKKAGSRLLVTLNGPVRAGEAKQTLVYVVDIISSQKVAAPLERAEGEERPTAEGMPEVTRNDKGEPSLAQPEGDAPKDLRVEETIAGTGPEITEGQNVKVHYSGWLWDDASTAFDSSWPRETPFDVEGVGSAPVITGWNEALLGQKVGSQILVVVPPEKGYGEQGSPPNIPPNAALVFVIDILSAVN